MNRNEKIEQELRKTIYSTIISVNIFTIHRFHLDGVLGI
jgi:hypothetical protein